MKYGRTISILPGLLAVGVLVTVSVVDAQPPQSVKRSAVERGVVHVGDEAPNFTLQDLAGNVISLSQLRGKVVLLNFWATWCGPCRVEMPAMEQLYRTLPRGQFEILAVSTDAQGAAVTRPFQKRMGFTFPILHDSEYRVGLAYGARTIPITFMVDRQGVVRQKIFGARDWDSPEARDLIHALMKS
ncbi:MAG: TlpA family protein disulfide reductase [Nitrospira sp.]|nr:TlpA family protein disulfide reductase [Nitrospira sp.]MBS0155667.1 TlpA family protein disulfide reductase [Nitrospira sp.]MBS0164460.1 TlpA family protein disulfide reductase [Nitrospira sp.]